MIFELLLILVCCQESAQTTSVHPLHGEWVVDWDLSLPRLDREMEPNSDPPGKKHQLREHEIGLHRNFGFVISNNQRRSVAGDKITSHRWSILAHDENNLLHNETYLLRTFDDEHSPELNTLSIVELIEKTGIHHGFAPYCIGFEFLDEDHLQSFNLCVRDGRLSGKRKVGWIVFKRGDGKQLLGGLADERRRDARRLFRPSDCVGTWIFDATRAEWFLDALRRSDPDATNKKITGLEQAFRKVRYVIAAKNGDLSIAADHLDYGKHGVTSRARTVARNKIELTAEDDGSVLVFRFLDSERAELVDTELDINLPIKRAPENH